MSVREDVAPLDIMVTALKAGKFCVTSPHNVNTIRDGQLNDISDDDVHPIEVKVEQIINNVRSYFWGYKYLEGAYLTADAVTSIVESVQGIKDPHHYYNGRGKVLGQLSTYGVWGDGNQWDKSESTFRNDVFAIGQDYNIDIHGFSDANGTFDSELGTNVAHDIVFGTNDDIGYGISKYDMQAVLEYSRRYFRKRGYQGNVCVNGDKYNGGGQALTKGIQEAGAYAFQMEIRKGLRDQLPTSDFYRFIVNICYLFMVNNPKL